MKATKKDLHESGRPLTQEEFINKIKTDDEFAKEWGDLGPVYGHQWRSWDKFEYTQNSPHSTAYGNVYKVDQIANVINLLKTDPDSRRMIVNAWNVGELDQMVLPPCHMMFQFYTRELSFNERLNYYDPKKLYHNEIDSWFLDELKIPKRAISLMFNMRSNDVPLGLPFNLASYGLLLEILAKHVNMVPDELIANIGDAHIYLNQIEGVKEQLTRVPYELPTVRISDRVVNDISEYEVDDFILENYQCHPSIKIPLSN